MSCQGEITDEQEETVASLEVEATTGPAGGLLLTFHRKLCPL